MEGRTAVAAEPARDEFWDLYSHFYDSVYRLMPYRELLWDVYEALDLQPGMRVLDAGCGTGNFELFVSEKNPPPVEIEAIDFSPSMLARAKLKCTHLDFAAFEWGDLNQALPYPGSTFDRIVSINVLYTLPDRDATLRELLRVLRPGGRIVMTSPKPDFSWGPLAADHFGRVGNIWGARRKAATVLGSLVVLATSAVGSFLLNALVINRRESAGRYHSLDEDELRALLEGHSQEGLAELAIEPAFADQNLFATATKIAGAHAV